VSLAFAVHLRHRFDVIVLSSFVFVLVVIEDIAWLDTVYFLCVGRIGNCIIVVWMRLKIFAHPFSIDSVFPVQQDRWKSGACLNLVQEYDLFLIYTHNHVLK